MLHTGSFDCCCRLSPTVQICNGTEKFFKTLNPLFPPGWLQKEMKNSTRASLKLKKRWFLLTHNSLDYYKSSERNALKLGTLVLNSLCSVVQPDEKVFKETGEKTNSTDCISSCCSALRSVPFPCGSTSSCSRQATGA